MDFQSYSLSISYRISNVVHRGGVDIFWNSPLAAEDRQIYICRKGSDYERIANLMFIMENDRKRYVAIKSLSRLLSSQNTKHKEKQYFCMNCLQGFSEELSRDEHIGYCKDNESVRTEMPHKRPIVEYLDEQFQFKVPFIM